MRQGERSDKRLRCDLTVSIAVAAQQWACTWQQPRSVAAVVSRIAVTGIGRQVDRRVMVMGGLGVIHLLMGEGVRLGELRRVQNR